MVREGVEGRNRDRRPQVGYKTVMTVIGGQAEKGVLRRVRTGRQYVYEPAVADEAAIAVEEVVRDFGEAAVAPFVDAARSDPKLRRRLERLLRGGPGASIPRIPSSPHSFPSVHPPFPSSRR